MRRESSKKSVGRASFADYKQDAANWITLAGGEFYPDILTEACELYKPVLAMFGQILKRSESSQALFMSICELKETWMRIQLARVFRKYVSPFTPVEMLKGKSKAGAICEQFGSGFRAIQRVQPAFQSRPVPDEALCAILWEYKDRGRKGYDLTEKFFSLFRKHLPSVVVTGPERAGKDILLGSIWPDFKQPKHPVDFVLKRGGELLGIGFARYDGDRGGAQEDDRTGGYRGASAEILAYAVKKKMRKVKLIFLNDGPGLLLGSMWRDYASIEDSGNGRILVCTLRMVPERLTLKWLDS